MLDLTCQIQMLLGNSLVSSLKWLGTLISMQHLPTHDLHVGQQVMYQDSTSKHWYPAVIDICVLSQEVTR